MIETTDFQEANATRMKKQKWLLFDVNYLAWRAFHTTGKLSHDGMGTGVMYGILRDVLNLQDLMDTPLIAFCFDRGKSLRCTDYLPYKANRGFSGTEWDDVKSEVDFQIRALRDNYLPAAGFKNLLSQKGYEADDIIASICKNLQRNQSAVVVSADHDMYQLLSERVKIWNPNKKRMTTKDSFEKEWGIEPEAWIDVKAIAGCSSDNISGVKGVGEKTAAKFLKGQLNGDSKAFQSIVSGNAIWQRNRHLVKLPYPGIKRTTLRVDKVTPEKWNKLAKKLGMKSLEVLR